MHKIHFSVRSYTLTMQSHSHDFHQLVIPLSGVIDIEVAGNRDVISPKRCAIIHSGAIHRFSAKENARFLVADLSCLPNNILSLSTPFMAISSALQALVVYIEHQLVQPYHPDTELHISALFFHLLSEQKHYSVIDKRIQGVISEVEQRLDQTITLDELSAIACLSKSQFKVLFKQQMGKTSGQYITMLRMQKARALLTYTDEPVARIAERVGYHDLSAFSRRFSLFFGQSPRSFIIR